MATAHRGARSLATGELKRRIAQTEQQLLLLRAEFHQSNCAVSAAERALLARRAEREAMAVRLARLADMLESLEAALAAEHTAAHTGTRAAR